MIDVKGGEYEKLRGFALDDFNHMTLAEIEERLLVLEYEKPMRIHNAKENDQWENEIEAQEIAHLDVLKAQLERKRQFILDRRDGWKARLFWSVVIPIVVSIITAYAIDKWMG